VKNHLIGFFRLPDGSCSGIPQKYRNESSVAKEEVAEPARSTDHPDIVREYEEDVRHS
jgi:hypothetical protein